MEKIKVNKEASYERVEMQFNSALQRCKDEAGRGYDSFTLTIRGDYEECYIILKRLEAFGVHVKQKGFSHYGKGSDSYGTAKVYIE